MKLTEDVPAPEIFCNGLGRVEAIGGGCGCFTLYRNTVGSDGGFERHIVAKIIAPIEAIPEAVELMLAAIGRAVMTTAVETVRRGIN